MSILRRGALLLTLWAGGCAAPDADQDGLSDSDEGILGLDPLDPDTDDDGLLDGDEIDLGTDPFDPDTDDDWLLDGEDVRHETDPLVSDTDGDSYLDGDEVFDGTDPLDASSLIYKGKWPFNRFKEDVERGSWAQPLKPGDVLGSFKGVDHYGQRVDLFDFSGEHQSFDYLVIDASAMWCGPCEAVTGWVSGEADPYDLDRDYEDVRIAVRKGDLAWVSVVTENLYGVPPDGGDVEQWHDQFPHKRIPVLADQDGKVMTGVVGAVNGWPAGVLVEVETMEVVAIDYVVSLLEDVQAAL